MDSKEFENVYNATNVKVLSPAKEDGTFIKIKNAKNTIFLAGPCPRTKEDYKNDWRYEAVEILNKLNFNGSVFNPTNEHYKEASDKNGDDTLEKQTKWEYEAMHKASAIVFWIPRSKEHPAFTTNIEIGPWIGKPGIFVGWPDNAIKNEYLGIRCKMAGMTVYNDLEELLTAVVKDLSRPKKNFFISDTHFGAKRTLELSRRPFRTVNDMDLEMISNWNKTVRMQDTVYHLGDFGDDFDYLKELNYKELKFVFGNYEKKDLENVKNKLNEFNDVQYFDNDELTFTASDGTVLTLRHEPLVNDRINKDKFYLFGHIHGKFFYKRNGLDVGVDAAGTYAPMDQETMEWRITAIKKYLDENVFTEYCK